MAKKVLLGHTSMETAFVQEDYPYGRVLRCRRRVWVETREGFGMRFMAQTDNPKTAHRPWNKPHAGQYAGIVILTLDVTNNHVEHVCVREHDREEFHRAVIAECSEAFVKDLDLRKRITFYLASAICYRLTRKAADEKGVEYPSKEYTAITRDMSPAAKAEAEAYVNEVAPLPT